MAQYIFYTAGDYKNMRVTGGTKRFREIILYLLQQGDEIFLMAPGNIDFPEDKNLTIIPVKTFHSKILPNGLLNFLLNIRKFKKISKEEYDTSVMVSIPYGIQAVLAGLKNITLIVWEDIIDYRMIRYRNEPNQLMYYLKKIVLPIYKKIERHTLKSVKRIVVQCNYDKEVLKSRHPMLKSTIDDKASVLFNNVNTSWLTRYSYLAGKKEKSKDKTKILFVGNINDERKGLHILLEAVAMLLEKNVPVSLEVIGEGKLKDHYKEQYANYKDIRFVGELSNPVPEIAKADMMVVPSQADSFPNTVLEGLYMEIPVLGAKNGGIPEILHYEELLFDSDPVLLADKIQDIITNNRLEQYRELCRKRKDALTFDWLHALKQIITE